MVIYRFACNCGCGQVSEDLEKDYIRLKSNQKWVAKGCEEKKTQVKTFKGGFIIIEEDF